jgi:hypothetical protein
MPVSSSDNSTRPSRHSRRSFGAQASRRLHKLDLAAVHARAGDTARARADFAQADTSHPHYRLYRGLFHAVLGETDEAYRWIEQVRDWPLAPLIGINNDPQYARLRADPRFAHVRRALKLD